MVLADVQPQSPPLTIPSANAPTPMASTSAPTASGHPVACSSRRSCSSRIAGSSAGRPIARLTKNTQRQLCH
jgi:hypothetical protein